MCCLAQSTPLFAASTLQQGRAVYQVERRLTCDRGNGVTYEVALALF